MIWGSDMNTRTKIKTAADALMTAALPVLMCYSLVGETAHEVVGIAMFGLFILHHALNFGWTKALFKGRYPPKRIVGTVVNAAVLICMMGLMYSSLVISKHVFAWLKLGGTAAARTVHFLCAYRGLTLMSVHLGMHISQIAARFGLKSKPLIWGLRVVSGAVAIVGIREFIKLRFADYMLGRVSFAFIDPTASAVLTMLGFLSVVMLFAYVGYLAETVIGKVGPAE